MFGAADADEVRAAWSSELAGFEAEDIRFALDACRQAHQEFPPTAFQFAGLCRDSKRRREQIVKSLPHAKLEPMPDKVKEQLREFLSGHVVRTKAAA
jgi:hypothetical protein